MKKLRLIVISIISIVLMTSVLQAQTIKQDQRIDKKEHEKQMRVDEKQLDLLVGQKESYRKIINRHEKKLKEILDSYPDKSKREEKIRQADESRNKELKSVLTDVQFEKFLKLDAERKKEIGKETRHEAH